MDVFVGYLPIIRTVLKFEVSLRVKASGFSRQRIQEAYNMAGNTQYLGEELKSMASPRSSTPDSSYFSQASSDERSDSSAPSSPGTQTPSPESDVDCQAQFDGKGTDSSGHPDPSSSSNSTEDNHEPKVQPPVLVIDSPSDPVSPPQPNSIVSQNNTPSLVLSSNESQTQAPETLSQTARSPQSPGPGAEPQTPEPSIVSRTAGSSTEPHIPEPSAETQTSKPSIAPQTAGSSTEAHIPEPSIEPQTPGSSIDPQTAGSSTEAHIPEPSAETQVPGSSIDPQTAGSSIESHTPEPSTEPQTPGPRLFKQRPSAAKEEWEWQKANGRAGDAEEAIDELMKLVGLEEVKEQVLAIKAKLEVRKRQGIETMEGERFNVVFQGNPGTGKTTVARIYARFLKAVGVLMSDEIRETSGAKLAEAGPNAAQRMINELLGVYDGGIIFVDEAYQLTAPYTPAAGLQVLDILLTEMENHFDELVVIFVGYNKEMESFFEHNPGLASRIPYTMQFADLDDAELWSILHDSINKKYSGKMKIEDGMYGLYMRIAIRRLARGRGVRGFGNARSVHNLLAQISERQAKRLAKQLRSMSASKEPDFFFFTKEDLIGSEPSTVESAAHAQLQELTGLDSVKQTAQSMIDMLQTNYLREIAEKNPLEFSLNRVFYGSPGTGKTTVAKLYGQLLADLGLLSNGEVVVKTPADFIGQCLGKSEAKTRAILATTVGKVLIIDEAYMLNSGGAGDKQDSFKTAVIDTIVAEVQSVPGDDRCVLLLGYEDKLKEMFQNVNPGLSRRFAIEDPFRFENFDVQQLEEILKLKMRQQDLSTTPQALEVALGLLDRARTRPNFSNGGDVENILAKAKLSYQARQSRKPPSERAFDAVFEPVDFDSNFARQAHAIANCRKRLENRVGEDIIEKLVGYQTLAFALKSRGRDPRDDVPTNFIFKGPAGTGKTTTAKNMGKVYYDMGFLSTDEVIEVSASELIGQYVGQTGPKTKTQLDRALGKVLFVDEAYRLAEGQYATEAVNELLYLLRTPRYAGKMIVILAGYTKDMNRLMTNRHGLSGLFPEEIVFQNIKPKDCLTLLERELKQRHVIPQLRKDSNDCAGLLRLFRMLSLFPGWSNARDIVTMAKEMAKRAVVSSQANISEEPEVSSKQAIKCMKEMAAMQRERSDEKKQSGKAHSAALNGAQGPSECAQDTTTARDGASCDIDIQTSEPSAPCTPDKSKGVARVRVHTVRSPSTPSSSCVRQQDQNHGIREKGVSDADWAQLQEKKRRGKTVEEDIQEKLRQMGVCENGFEWIEEDGGYRCAGGWHFVGHDQLE